MYYIHLHGNYGCLYILLPGMIDWTSVSIEYCQDFLHEIQESKARQVLIKELPEDITDTFGFEQIKDSIRVVYQLNTPGTYTNTNQ
jgi:hypothetical protein